MAWQWDESLYAGSASHYALGRMAYPQNVADVIREELGLTGEGRLLDVGCGPGSLTLVLAPLFEAAVGVDADPGMIARAAEAGASNVEWRVLRGEHLSADLGVFRVATFAQSFHWMDQDLVARRVHALLSADGACIHVRATTSHGVAGDDPHPHPRPPWERIDELVAEYLGSSPRAGRSTPPGVSHPAEEEAMSRAGFTGLRRRDVVRGEILDRGVDAIVSSVFSLSRSAPHQFGSRLAAFERDLRMLLLSVSPAGQFSERARDITLMIWRP
jgi:SAM-dependent methyltransferase